MENNKVFQDMKELERLKTQNELLKPYEQPIYDRVAAQCPELAVLDIGCNNGSKVVERFGNNTITRLIGLEYLPDLAKTAQETYGSDKFAFYQCDVEASDFGERLCQIMEQNNIEAFQVINISFVLMHLKDPKALLELLHSFLAPGGHLLVVEANDGMSVVSPDEEGVFDSFLDILYQDSFSGDRECGVKIPAYLKETGYQQILLENTLVHAGQGDKKKKSAIFETFLSYLPEDVLLLQQAEPDNSKYTQWKAWTDKYFGQLKSLILEHNTMVSMGISIITCKGAEK